MIKLSKEPYYLLFIFAVQFFIGYANTSIIEEPELHIR